MVSKIYSITPTADIRVSSAGTDNAADRLSILHAQVRRHTDSMGNSTGKVKVYFQRKVNAAKIEIEDIRYKYPLIFILED